MTSNGDIVETVRRLTPRSDLLRQVRLGSYLVNRVNVLGRAGAFNLAVQIPKISDSMPHVLQTPTANIGADIARLVSGRSSVAAFANSQAISARLVDMFKPATLPVDMQRIVAPFQRDILAMSQSLTESTRLLAGVRLPARLEGAAAGSTRGWRMVLDDLASTASAPAFERASYAGTHTLSTSVAARMLRPIDVEVIEVDPIKDDQVAADDALAIGEHTRAQIRERLGDVHPRLTERLDGAWTTLALAGPDAASQAAHSIQELIDATLREVAPDENVMAWYEASTFSKKVSEDLFNRRPTRRLRARYLLRGRPEQAPAAKLFLGSIGTLGSVLQGAKHAIDDGHGPHAIRMVLLTVEAFLGYVILDD